MIVSLKEFFGVVCELLVAFAAMIVAGVSLLILGIVILGLFGFNPPKPEDPYYKNQIDRCREKGDVILDSLGYLKECRLKSFD